MKFVYPLKNESFSSNSGFGQRNNANHTGIDLKANSGTRVLASLPGTVVQSDDANTSYGGYILIKHDLDGETYYTRYAHLRNRYKNFSDKVSAGEQIGESGGASTDRNRGNATGPHLHFELLNDSRQPIDPEPYLKSGEIGVGDSKEENKNKISIINNHKAHFAKPISYYLIVWNFIYASSYEIFLEIITSKCCFQFDA